MKSFAPNLVDSMAAASPSRKILERRIAEMGMGILDALRNSRITFDQAWEDFFNLDNYEAIRRRRLNPKLKEFFSWGMELENVAEIAPHGLPESYEQMTKLARQVIAMAKPKVSVPAKQHARMRRSA